MNTANTNNHPLTDFFKNLPYSQKCIIGCDTSGSVSASDNSITDIGIAVESAVRIHRINASFVNWDTNTEINDIKTVKHFSDLDIHLGGGTCMEMFYQYISSLKQEDKPDFSILITDGYIDWKESIKEMGRGIKNNIVLVTKEDGMEYAKRFALDDSRLTVIPIF